MDADVGIGRGSYSRVHGANNQAAIRSCAVITGLFASYLLLHLYAIFLQSVTSSGDFFALWSYPKIALMHRAADLYDLSQIHAAQVSLGMDPAGEKPFPYPPTFLLMLWPVGMLPYTAAFVAWIAATAACYVCAVCRGARPLWLVLTGTLLAPTTTINIAFGQSGFLLAALLIGGLRLMGCRPVLAGILFGLLSYKPQFGILVPVVLVASRQWLCIAAACATLVALFGMTSIAFGKTIWLTWLHSLPTYVAWFDHRTATQMLRTTVTDNLQILGCPPGIVSAAQAAAMIIAFALAWISFRRGPNALAIPVVVAATCLATPHAFIYDLPMLTGAVMLYVAHRLSSDAPFSPPELTVILLTLTFPAAIWACHVPISAIAVSSFLMLLLIARRAEPSERAPGARDLSHAQMCNY